MPRTVNGLDEIKALAGQHLGYSEWWEITQDRVNKFADATDDHQWIHVDPERAKTGPYGGPIAHGYLTLSLLIPLWSEILQIEGIKMAINYGLNRVRFTAPVPVGSKIRLGAKLADLKELSGGGVEALVEAVVEVEGATKPAVVAEAVYRYYG
jgi:acyl dehydratase